VQILAWRAVAGDAKIRITTRHRIHHLAPCRNIQADLHPGVALMETQHRFIHGGRNNIRNLSLIHISSHSDDPVR